jgi:hypothetical protein
MSSASTVDCAALDAFAESCLAERVFMALIRSQITFA